MILKALYDYYQKLKDLGEVAPAGAQKKAIQFIIVIDAEGKLKTSKTPGTATEREKFTLCQQARVPAR